MTTRVDTVEAPLSPSVTSPLPHAGTQPHGRKGDRATPARLTMTRRRVASLAADAAFRCLEPLKGKPLGFCRWRWASQTPRHGVTPIRSPLSRSAYWFGCRDTRGTSTGRCPWLRSRPPQSLRRDLPCRPSTWATNGIGFTCRPSRHNRLPMSFVKVLIDGSTTGIGGQTGLRAALVQPVALLAIRFTSPVNGWGEAEYL